MQQQFLFSRPDRVLKHRHVQEGCGKADRADLWACFMVYNSPRWRSRWKLAEDSLKRAKQAGAKVALVEVAHGHRDFVLGGDPSLDLYLSLETESEIWLKEAAQNLLMAKIASVDLGAQYFAFMDADVALARDDWANETVQQLQHYDIVQMWSEAIDLGPRHTTISRHHSFVYSWLNHEEEPPNAGYYGGPSGGQPSVHLWHPGFCWAYRKQALVDLGRLLTVGILGAGDNHMAKALVGNADRSIHPSMGAAYRREVLEWQHRAQIYLRNGIGLVEGQLIHYWHGAKAKRRYWDRWKILTECQFNPDTDIKPDWQGLPRLVVEDARQRRMRDLIRQYFRERDEDATTEG